MLHASTSDKVYEQNKLTFNITCDSDNSESFCEKPVVSSAGFIY